MCETTFAFLHRFPTRVQHPTLLSQSLSGPLEAAAPYLHDAPILPHAQVRSFGAKPLYPVNGFSRIGAAGGGGALPS